MELKQKDNVNIFLRIEATTARIRGKPWRRFWARRLDIILFSYTCLVLLFLIDENLASWFIETKGAFLVFSVLVLPFSLLLEAYTLWAVGTTPGKWLLNISLHKQNGASLTFKDTLHRGILIWVKGYALGVPLIEAITMAVAADRIDKGGSASWDDAIAIDVRYGQLNSCKVVVLCIVLSVFIFTTLLEKGAARADRRAKLRASIPTLAPAPTAPLVAQAPIAPTQLPMSSAGPQVHYKADVATEAAMKKVANKIYRRYPYLDVNNDNNNFEAIGAVSQACAGFAGAGMPFPIALRRAADEIAPRYGPSDVKHRMTASGIRQPGFLSIPMEDMCLNAGTIKLYIPKEKVVSVRTEGGASWNSKW
ncbi:RDD family protein [Geomonas anaerohicana]|uniref:RDD family protein n=1 Tax=Geomonas anaerohicana TaxID=2798583 RepID=A0ABS0YDA4_9BACT|nr:RDD family protein [Geomonas anaerohicana]MBJ6749899.1 RDD family protein [Geomonas anaerohicana]